MKTTELKKIIRKIFRKKPTKLSWPMSAKSDTQLPGFIYNEIGIFLDCLQRQSDRESRGD